MAALVNMTILIIRCSVSIPQQGLTTQFIHRHQVSANYTLYGNVLHLALS